MPIKSTNAPRPCESYLYDYETRIVLRLASMPPPSQLAIATSAVSRLIKEEGSYHKELEQQHARVQRLEGEEGDENAEFTMRQEVGHGMSRLG